MNLFDVAWRGAVIVGDVAEVDEFIHHGANSVECHAICRIIAPG